MSGHHGISPHLYAGTQTAKELMTTAQAPAEEQVSSARAQVKAGVDLAAGSAGASRDALEAHADALATA